MSKSIARFHRSVSSPRFVLLTAMALLGAVMVLHQMFFARSAQAVSASVVISQVYGGGGNSGATFKNDFIELFNRGNSPTNLNGWSVQYASAPGTTWQVTNLTNVTIQPGQYYLVQEALGAGGTTDLPSPDASGNIAINASAGKVALVNTTTALTGSGCPFGAGMVDFLAFGLGTTCSEGSAAPAPSNTTAALRVGSGCTDTDSNSTDFATGMPNPRNTSALINACTGGDSPPRVSSTSPFASAIDVPHNSNIRITFDEPVNVTSNWFQISCTNSGIHTASTSGGAMSFTLNPDVDFSFNESCTVTVFAGQVTDQDVSDPPDNMAANYVFSFTVFSFTALEHMVMGNPTDAVADADITTNYLMMKTQYALSYNDGRGTPNWTSWHLDSTWLGSITRPSVDFEIDPALPPNFHPVRHSDYTNTGFDRGHMCPSADRTSTDADNLATFLTTNIVPQAPDNNSGPWLGFEEYLRTFLPGSELYIMSGGSGTGGTGDNGYAETIAGGFVNVPAKIWKVALILPVGDNDVSRVDNNTRTIAVIMDNINGDASHQWRKYLATVDQVEALTGYDFYSNVPPAVQDVIEARLDPPPPPSVVQLSATNYGVTEDCTTVTITVNRVGDTSGPATVNYSTSDVTASERRDYITAIGTLRFNAGETSKSLAVLINEDSYVEGPETFNVNLSNPSGAGLGAPTTATVTITDDAIEQATNVIDDPRNFVCQHYHDFLNRHPDQAGWDFWTNQITSCGTDAQCIEVKRINVSAAFYLSIEFQETGYLVERIYKASYGDASGTSTFNGVHQLPVPIVRFNEFLSDTQEIGQGVIVNQGNWQQQLEDNKNAFTAEFVQRSRFVTAFPPSMTPAQFVDTLNTNAGNPLSQSERDQLVNNLSTSAKTRAQVLRAVAEDPDLNTPEFNRAFVLMQYFGYLRRNPNDPQDTDYTGYDFWLTKLNQFNGNFVNAEMVKAFILSGEYRQRFGP